MTKVTKKRGGKRGVIEERNNIQNYIVILWYKIPTFTPVFQPGPTHGLGSFSLHRTSVSGSFDSRS